MDLNSLANSAVDMVTGENEDPSSAVAKIVKGHGLNYQKTSRICERVNQRLMDEGYADKGTREGWRVQFDTAKPEKVSQILGAPVDPPNYKFLPGVEDLADIDPPAKISSLIPDYRQRVSPALSGLVKTSGYELEYTEPVPDQAAELSDLKKRAIVQREEIKSQADRLMHEAHQQDMAAGGFLYDVIAAAKTSGVSYADAVHVCLKTSLAKSSEHGADTDPAMQLIAVELYHHMNVAESEGSLEKYSHAYRQTIRPDDVINPDLPLAKAANNYFDAAARSSLCLSAGKLALSDIEEFDVEVSR